MKLGNLNTSRLAIGLAVFVGLFAAFTSDALGQVNAATWDKPETVQRQAKPKRQPHPTPKPTVRPKVQRAPLLTVRYRVLIKRADGTVGESSMASRFHTGDQLRLAVTANQEGYLYVIYQKENQDGLVMFPDSRVNDGGNYVSKNREFILPPVDCPLPDPNGCWYTVSDDPAKEFFIIVFSRDQILDLPNTPGGAEAVKSALANGVLKKEVIDSYITSARLQDYKIYSPRAAGSSSRYAVWVTNVNRSDNEEIIVRVPLNKGT